MKTLKSRRKNQFKTKKGGFLGFSSKQYLPIELKNYIVSGVSDVIQQYLSGDSSNIYYYINVITNSPILNKFIDDYEKSMQTDLQRLYHDFIMQNITNPLYIRIFEKYPRTEILSDLNLEEHTHRFEIAKQAPLKIRAKNNLLTKSEIDIYIKYVVNAMLLSNTSDIIKYVLKEHINPRIAASHEQLKIDFLHHSVNLLHNNIKQLDSLTPESTYNNVSPVLLTGGNYQSYFIKDIEKLVYKTYYEVFNTKQNYSFIASYVFNHLNDRIQIIYNKILTKFNTNIIKIHQAIAGEEQTTIIPPNKLKEIIQTSITEYNKLSLSDKLKTDINFIADEIVKQTIIDYMKSILETSTTHVLNSNRNDPEIYSDFYKVLLPIAKYQLSLNTITVDTIDKTFDYIKTIIQNINLNHINFYMINDYE